MKVIKLNRRERPKTKPGEYLAEPLVTCPAPCGKTVYLTRGEDGEPGLIHQLPMCELFDRLEPNEYLTHVRRSLGIPDPPEGASA